MRALIGLALVLSAVFGAPRAVAYSGDLVVMQGLDKVTARVSTFEAPLGGTVRFGTLSITVQRCERTPPEEPPESTVFLEIFEIRPDKDPTPLFRGWMFASSPALSALEHPVYDVWVLECKRTAPPPEAEAGKNQ
jgi:hypothetical protein